MNERLKPDQILKDIQKESGKEKQGHLKIFFGYAAGVGKTYAMLEAAHKEKNNNIDVVIGYIEPHDRKETMALVEGLERLPTLDIHYNQMILHEFDIDQAINRKPELILVDELAHTNAVGMRHKKRYQDIKELLSQGIDVYTTLNVQHIESLNDIIASITGVFMQERIPDYIFDEANQVELIDIEPQDLMTRLETGKIYHKNRVQNALNHFFHLDNLIALREIALRRCADRINKLNEQIPHDNYYTGEHILVCISASPTNAKVIRTAARMAAAFKARLTALYIETPDYINMKDEEMKLLRENLHLAQQFGAKVEAVVGSDIAYQIAEYARLSNVSKIVIGHSQPKKTFFMRPTLVKQLTTLIQHIDIYIIPVHEKALYQQKKNKEKQSFVLLDFIKTVGIIMMATIIGYLFRYLGFSEANIITVYILGVLITAIVTTKRLYSIMSSIISVLVFNFFFTTPYFTFMAFDEGYPMTFIIMLLASIITSNLATKIQRNAKQYALTAYRTKVLLDTNQLLQKETEKEGILKVLGNQLMKLLNKDIIIYPKNEINLDQPLLFTIHEQSKLTDYLETKEQAVVEWVFKNNKQAGHSTQTLPNAKCLYFALGANENVYGVVGIKVNQDGLDSFEQSIVLSIIGEASLALEREKADREKRQAEVKAKNEQLRANLLRSISHDLRTPLTSIFGNADILLSDSFHMSYEKKKELYSHIYDDSLWLIHLIENLLSVTRIEDGHMHLNFNTELLNEVVYEAVSHVSRKRQKHEISIQDSEDYILVKIDAHLFMQVIINLVDNAIKYTPDDSKIIISIYKKGNRAMIDVIDNGQGISNKAKERIFDMFYTGDLKVVDSHRSLGLGLALCQSIIEAHQGTINVIDNKPHGAIFRIQLPIEEVNIHEQ